VYDKDFTETEIGNKIVAREKKICQTIEKKIIERSSPYNLIKKISV